MDFPNRLKGPVFLKEDSDAERQLDVLRALEPSLSEEGQLIIRQDWKGLLKGKRSRALTFKYPQFPISQT